VSDDLTALAEQSLAGDASSVRLLVERLHRPVLGLCLRMLAHRQDAEDVAQESLVRMVRYLGTWDRNRPFLPWVLTVAANRCRTAMERRRSQPRARVMSPDMACPASTTEAGAAGKQEISQIVDLALQQLREEYRMAFILFHLEGMTIDEVCQVLSVPNGTVKTWLHRARKELAEILRANGVEPGDAS
jgi:RNA polymerase sigma-70 factor (ECF subfamily)